MERSENMSNTNPEDHYIELMQSVALVGIRMVEGSFSTRVEMPPQDSTVEIQANTGWRHAPEGFVAEQLLDVVFSSVNEIGRIHCKFELLYNITTAHNSEEFVPEIQKFVEENTPFNSWPYLREYVNCTLQRLCWPPFLLPLLKQRVVAGKETTVTKTEQ